MRIGNNMIKIIDKRGTGKTLRLIMLAKEQNGIIVCQNPAAMKEKVVHGYGIVGIDFISYDQYIRTLSTHQHFDSPVFIDEISIFLQILDDHIHGFTESEE